MASSGKPLIPPPFEKEIERHEREIMRFILRSTGDREDAKDLFQETWLRAYRAYPMLRSVGAFRPWIFHIAANLCRNRARDRARRSRVFAATSDDTAVAIEQAGSHGNNDEVLNLKRAIARLPGNQGRALTMRKFAGLEYGEIAAALHCSQDSARASVYKALKKLNAER